MIAPDRSCPADALASRTGWAPERVLFAPAGTVTLLGAALAAVVSPWFLLLVAFVGVNQWLFAALGDCPMSLEPCLPPAANSNPMIPVDNPTRTVHGLPRMYWNGMLKGRG